MIKNNIKITYLLTVFFLLNASFSEAKNNNDSVPDTCSLSLIESRMDSLFNVWYVRDAFIDSNDEQYSLKGDSLVPVYNDSVYLNRIKAIQSYIPLSYNKIVRNFIHVYTVKKRDKLAAIIGLKEHYFPLFEEILDQKGLPLELKYVPVIESALNPNAVSRAGATGLWQFMYGTGKMYGLNINSYIDERRDPLKSSFAASNYLADLYGMFDDWMMAIAAYNCGPTNVYKAMRRSGGKNNYWDIYYYLPRETRGYVPAFIAAMYAMTYFEDHNIKPQKINIPVATDTIIMNKTIHLKQISAVLQIPYQKIKDLNPQYRRSIVPADHGPYPVNLPIDITGNFIQLQDSIYAYNRDQYLNKSVIHKKPSTYKRSSYHHQPPSGNYSKLYYTIKSGDNLGYIAEWYNVRASDLRYWNNIRGSMIRRGQKLIVYVPKNKLNYYKPVNSLSFEQKQRRTGNTVNKEQKREVLQQPYDGHFVYYTVRPGDTLWEIAKRFPGVSDLDIMQLNNIKDGENIKPGQRIKIKSKTNEAL